MTELAYTGRGLQHKQKSMAGSTLSNPAMTIASIDANRCYALAPAARPPPRYTAARDSPAHSASATAAATAASADRAAPAAPAATTAAAATPSPGHLYPLASCFRALLVEHIECRQTDVGDFLFTERDLVVR